MLRNVAIVAGLALVVMAIGIATTPVPTPQQRIHEACERAYGGPNIECEIRETAALRFKQVDEQAALAHSYASN